MNQEEDEKYPIKEEPNIQLVKLIINDNIEQLKKLHYERYRSKR